MKIIIIGDYNPDYPPHPATTKSLEYVSEKAGIEIDVEWLDSEKLTEPFEILFEQVSGIWLGPAPYKNKEGVRKALKFIRENDIAFIGTCGGLYQAVAEFAINVLELDERLIEIHDGDNSDSLFLRDTCCAVHGFSVIDFKTVEGTKAHTIYPVSDREEDSNCGFAVNAKYYDLMQLQNLIISGIDESGEAKLFELSSNTFYMLTKFLPQMRSKPEMPHPLIKAFVKASL